MKHFKKIPNQITLVRLLLVPVLWILAAMKLPTIFAIVFAIAGLTDWLDGYAARKLKQTSKFGIWFDSFADNIMSASAIFWIWMLVPTFLYENLIVIIILFALFLGSLGIGFLKYGKMVDYHLYSDKAAAVFLYVFIVHALLLEPNQIFLYITAIVLGLALFEEILVTITHDKMQKNKHSIFI